jgi:hypothetical protein
MDGVERRPQTHEGNAVRHFFLATFNLSRRLTGYATGGLMKSARLLVIVCVLSGCNGNTPDINGTVVWSQSDPSDSIMLGEFSMRPEYTPLAGATVLLAVDREGQQPVPGSQTTSDAQGRYTIKTQGLPRSATEYGNDYYLIVMKEGYRSLRVAVTTGPFAATSNSHIVLLKRAQGG